MEGLLNEEKYNIPRVCKKCGGVLVYQGVGEYLCEDCHEEELDDYGKVRRFIEKHSGATAAQIELYVGVSQKVIRQMLKDGRIQIAAESRSFLQCELCGKTIRFGQFCTDCEVALHRNLEASVRTQKAQNKKEQVKIFGVGHTVEDGQIRFERKGKK